MNDLENCPLCDEPIYQEEVRDFNRIKGLGNNRPAHQECLLRTVLGGIGHLEDHEHWCNKMHDPDGGRTFRQSALEVKIWVKEHGIS